MFLKKKKKKEKKFYPQNLALLTYSFGVGLIRMCFWHFRLKFWAIFENNIFYFPNLSSFVSMSFRQQGSNNGGQMYPGDGSFRHPGARPQFQNSHRYPQQSPSHRGNMRSPQNQPYFTPPHNPGYASPYYRTLNNSSPYTSTPDHMRRQAPRSQRGYHRHSQRFLWACYIHTFSSCT